MDYILIGKLLILFCIFSFGILLVRKTPFDSGLRGILNGILISLVIVISISIILVVGIQVLV